MKIILKIISVCVFLTFIKPIDGYKILVVCSAPAKSHYNLCKGAADALHEQGHEVTILATFASKKPKYREIIIPELLVLKDKLNMGFNLNKMSKLKTLSMILSFQSDISELVFGNEDHIKFFNDKSEQFDGVIFSYFMNDFMVGYGVKYDCPVIALCPASLISSLATITNNPVSLATVPNLFTPFIDKMTLKERVINCLVELMQQLMGFFYMDPLHAELYRKYFPEEAKRVSYDELKTKIAGILVNAHPSAGVARPMLPHAVEVGGYHIGEPEPLPGDLKRILDTAKHGVIYFAMGSNLKSSEMEPEMKEMLISEFRKLKETVVWKFEEDLPNKPSNVIIKNWMPQSGILAHPNVKLFISHCGLLSVTEATSFGVPLLCIPIFGDQPYNAMQISHRQQGIQLLFTNVTQTSFEWALNEALGNPTYRQKAKEIEKLFHDRPIKPKQLLIHHVEHIIRTNGAPHLSPPPLPRYSHLLMDVAAVIIIPILLINTLLVYCCYRCCCSKSKSETKLSRKAHKRD